MGLRCLEGEVRRSARCADLPQLVVYSECPALSIISSRHWSSFSREAEVDAHLLYGVAATVLEGHQVVALGRRRSLGRSRKDEERERIKTSGCEYGGLEWSVCAACPVVLCRCYSLTAG